MRLWGGRYEQSPSEKTWRFTTDHHDRRLLLVDIEGSMAHAEMLGEVGAIGEEESAAIVDGLARILTEATAGEFVFLDSDEDVHTAVERRLFELAGEVAGRLHTGRSRNDQVALDLRLYLGRAGAERIGQLRSLAGTLSGIAELHAETVIPSYTHLQQAQPTTLGHHLLAYAWMALREADRFSGALQRISVSPLGAGAAAGTSLPLDREMVARRLGLAEVIPNSLDAVGSRDFVSEYVFCCAQSMVDLSRLAEEIVFWSSREFGWARLPDHVSTGSSALPHKRNPDTAELIRGRSATVAADMTAILTLQKALPLAYNRDLQEDKRIVFHADDVLASAITAMTDLVEGIEFDPPLPGPDTVSLDLAEALVRRAVPFREAHERIGELVSRLEADGRTLADADLDDLKGCHGSFEEPDLKLLDPVRSVTSRASSGSGSPDSVRAQVAEIRRRLTG
jgi:argininosuccinate lyase